MIFTTSEQMDRGFPKMSKLRHKEGRRLLQRPIAGTVPECVPNASLSASRVFPSCPLSCDGAAPMAAANLPPLSPRTFLKLKEEHPHLLLHQLRSLHLRPGPHHLHHAHLQARPGEWACIGNAPTAGSRDFVRRACHIHEPPRGRCSPAGSEWACL